MLPITSVFASLATLMYIALAFRVIAIRRSQRISLGAGSDDPPTTEMYTLALFDALPILTLLWLMSQPVGLKLRTLGVITCFTTLIILVITLLSFALF